MPPLPPTTSDAAAAPYRAATGRLSPRTILAVRVPTKASPAPVWSTTAGAGMASTQDECSIALELDSVCPAGHGHVRRPEAAELVGRFLWRGAVQQCGGFPGEGRGDQEGPRRQFSEDRRRFLHGGQPRPEVGIENEAAGQCRRLEDRGPRGRRRWRRRSRRRSPPPPLRRPPASTSSGERVEPDAARAGVGELPLTLRVGVHQVDALLPGPELQQVGGNAEFPDPGGDRLAEVVVGAVRPAARRGHRPPRRQRRRSARRRRCPAGPEHRGRTRRRWPPQARISPITTTSNGWPWFALRCVAHQSCTDPSSRRLMGRYLGSNGKAAAASSLNSTPMPGASPGCM